jgi:hypothetical protein
MRKILFALAVAAVIAFTVIPVLASCECLIEWMGECLLCSPVP